MSSNGTINYAGDKVEGGRRQMRIWVTKAVDGEFIHSFIHRSVIVLILFWSRCPSSSSSPRHLRTHWLEVSASLTNRMVIMDVGSSSSR